MSVGKSVARKDALEKVRGTEKFVADLRLPGMLYAKMVMSSSAHAQINLKGISDRKLRKNTLILTAADIPGKNILPLVFSDMPFLPVAEVNFHGQPIALIAAEDKNTLIDAVRAYKVEYMPLPAVLSIEDALKKDAPRVYGTDNIFKSYRIVKGNAHEAFKQAPRIAEDTYRTPYQEHAYLETQGMLAVPDSDGSMTVYGSMQCPFYVRDAVASILGLPLSKVRIIQAATGGGFGGKEDIPSLMAAYASLLSWKSGRPVQLVLSREEDLIFSSKRHPSITHYRTAYDEQGRIKAVIVKYYLNAGAYATLSPVVLWRGTVHAAGPYRIDNVLVETYAVATNLVPCGAYRGFGTPQILFAHESQLDEIAHSLGRDPLEIRRINLISEGDTTATNQKLTESVGARETLEKALKSSGYKQKIFEFKNNPGKEEWRKGIGLSTVFYGVGLGAGGKHLDRSGAFVQLNADGSAEVAAGNTEMGQGYKTVIAQIAASELGISYERVRILDVDSSRVPDSGPTVASRATFMSGNAVIVACRELKTRLLPALSEKFSTSVSAPDVLWKNDKVIQIATGREIELQELAKFALYEKKTGLSTVGWYVAPNTTFDNENGQGDAYFTYSYATNIAEVAVNLRTGEIKVERITACHEIGKAINPQQVEGQIQGGTLQGAGYATCEEILHDNGLMKTTGFSTYIIPTVLDAPEIVPLIAEKPYSQGPYGGKGFGELPLMGVAPAITNAVRNATGVKFCQIPLTPERVFQQLKDANQAILKTAKKN
ncbi:MAG: xanthine dehydrogenase family protein molybdopterin-binding subunit [Candidatus Wallbacteria bacterium]|nr:xanthine dehydrogenase family protein molybdopterin-binding subunit [Candidatus Wallbacteria bacterium]